METTTIPQEGEKPIQKKESQELIDLRRRFFLEQFYFNLKDQSLKSK